jgi:hypothetical protein
MNIQFFSKQLLSEETVTFKVTDNDVVALLNNMFYNKMEKSGEEYCLDKDDYDKFLVRAKSTGLNLDAIEEKTDELDEESGSAVVGTGTGSGAAGAYLPALDVPEKKYKGPEYKNESKSKKDITGWDYAPSIKNRPSKGGFIYKDLWESKEESLDENYSRFRKETKTRNEAQQYYEAIKAAHKKLNEANRILEYSKRLKEEMPEYSLQVETKNTKKSIEKLKLKIAEAYKKVKNL